MGKLDMQPASGVSTLDVYTGTPGDDLLRGSDRRLRQFRALSV